MTPSMVKLQSVLTTSISSVSWQISPLSQGYDGLGDGGCRLFKRFSHELKSGIGIPEHDWILTALCV